jgi:hypothetical protein
VRGARVPVSIPVACSTVGTKPSGAGVHILCLLGVAVLAALGVLDHLGTECSLRARSTIGTGPHD